MSHLLIQLVSAGLDALKKQNAAPSSFQSMTRLRSLKYY